MCAWHVVWPTPCMCSTQNICSEYYVRIYSILLVPCMVIRLEHPALLSGAEIQLSLAEYTVWQESLAEWSNYGIWCILLLAVGQALCYKAYNDIMQTSWWLEILAD